MATSAAAQAPVPADRDLRIRPLRDGDTATVERVFAQLSATSAYQRFGTGVSRLGPRSLLALAAVATDQQGVLVAEVGGRPVGLGRWVRGPYADRPSAAEIALEVADAWQGRGIGRRLVAAVAEDAERSGVESLLAYVDLANGRMTGWLRRLGAANPTAVGDPFVLSVQVARRAARRAALRAADAEPASAGCGCMTACSSASSARSGWGTGSTRPSPHAESDPVTSSLPSSRGAGGRSRPRWSSTSSGEKQRVG
jgi:ribosomal protein S18 acetylase RimI-like enzyme